MDPLTILASIKAAHSTIKTAIAVGKELHHIAKDLSDLMNGVAKLTQESVSPSGWKTKGSAEARAIEAYSAKMEAQQLEADIRNAIVGKYGLKAWDSIQRNVIIIRKEMKRQAAIEYAKRIALIEACLTGGIVVILMSIVVWILYLAVTYRHQGW